MNALRISLLLVTVLGVFTPLSNAQANKVEIFYETLNDAVRRFYVEQFKVATDNLGSLIDLSLIPYGNTVKNADDTYTCPYGDLQCEANKIHGCLIVAETTDGTQNAAALTQFSNCFFKNRFANEGVEDLGERCLPADATADWGEIRICVADSGTNAAAVDAFGTATADVSEQIKTDGLVVRIGGNVNEAAKTNLVGAICTALGKDDGICEGWTQPNKVKLGIYYEAFNTDAGNYLVRQLGTYYHVLEDFVDIELIPYGNTQHDGSGGYNCTNDPQCISNKYQALAVNSYINQVKNGHPISGINRAVNFISCVFKSTVGNTFDALEICTNQHLSIDDYITFLQHIRGDTEELKTVFESMRTKTAAVASSGVLPRVPVVTLNGQVDYNAFDDLVQEACNQYSSTIKAGICTKVNITVLYEALNHKSRTLFLEQLNPVFDNLYNLINLQMIPAGRAVLVPGQGIVCPGGLEQCNMMKLQACAIDFFFLDGNNYTDPIRQEVFDFIVCTMKNKRMLNVMDSAEVCSEEDLEFDAWWTIHGCYLDGTGTAILAEYIEETHSIIQNVDNHAIPIVLINDKEVTDLSHIKAQVCALFDDYHSPDYCFSDLPEKVKIQVYYESMNELSKFFFSTQYDPWYIYVEEMASIELFPAGNLIESNANDGTCDSYDANSACLGNKFQAFIIDKYSKHDDDGDYIDGTLRTMRFLGCYFNHVNFKDNAYVAAEYCAEETLPNDEWFDLLTTVKSPEGSAIYKTVLDATAAFKTQNEITAFDILPWVTLDNNKHSHRAQDDLLQTVCSQYQGDKPLECTPVQVDVYYSAINPQSRRFFIEQLIPTFRVLRERMHVQLIPYGVPNADQTIEEECLAKDKICLANKIQACAIAKFFEDDVIDNSVQWDGRNQTLLFINCMFKNMKNLDIYPLAEECANQNVIFGEEILQCARQEEGDNLLKQMREKTMGQFETMEHAPWIVLNGHRAALGQTDLKQAVCDNMVGDKPDYCYEATPAKVKVEFHYSTVDNKVQSYVINELYPHYRLLEEIIDLDVVPFGLTEVLQQGDGGYTLICPQGVQECQANLIHACIYGQYFHADDDPVSDSQNQNEYDHKLMVVEYINCYFTSPKYPAQPVDAGMECVELIFGDDFSTVHECVNGQLGIQLLLEFQEKKVQTLLPHLTYTPWITLNGKHNYAIENHIQRTVCNSYTGRYKPEDCYQIYDTDDKPVVEIHYEPGDSGSIDFFINKLVPEHITEISQLKLVPFGRSTYTDSQKNCVNDQTASPNECAIYKEHACVIDLWGQSEPIKTIQIIACTFGDFFNDTENVVNDCVDLILEGDNWGLVHTCVGEKGDALLKANHELTSGLNPKISHVPWIYVNGEHNVEAEVSLVNELCSVYFPADKPAFCLPDLLEVGVYYETLNSDVNNFFLSQLAQYTEYLDEIGKFSFIPYGSTRSSGGQFTCNKDNQCLANIAHACILNRFYNRSSTQPESEYEKNRIRFAGFLECTAFRETNGETEPVLVAEECLDQNFEGDYWRDIHFCFMGPEGQELYSEMARQTNALSPALSSAPYITISSQKSDNALTNLFQTLCNTYSLVRPPLCATLPSLAVKVGIYFSSNAAGQKYIREQLLPFYQEIVPVLRDEARLHQVIAPELVAWGETTYDSSASDNPFTCPGGATECYINRFFACVNYYHGQEAKATLHQVEFAICFFSQSDALTNPQSAANICANRVWIPDPYPQLETCATENTQAAYDIFLRMRDKTENNYPHFTSYPAVTINNIRDPDAEQNLLQSVCLNYKGNDAPTECQQFTQTPTTQTTPTTPTQTTPASVTTPGSGTTAPQTTPGSGSTTPAGGTTAPPTTPGGSGTTPSISIFVLLVSFFVCRFVY